MLHYLLLKLSDFNGVIAVYISSLYTFFFFFLIYKPWALQNSKFMRDLFGIVFWGAYFCVRLFYMWHHWNQ